MFRTLDEMTDRWADAGVKYWHQFLLYLHRNSVSVMKWLKESWKKFRKWFDRATDGEYDPDYEDDIIVKLWEQKVKEVQND